MTAFNVNATAKRENVMRSIRLAALFALLIAGAPAFAWNSFGHMTVAAVAYSHLTPTARTQVIQLLKLNPSYSHWIAGVPAAQRGEVAFMRAAYWPDFIRRADGYINDGEQPTDPNAASNIGYSDKLMHKYWHYVDLPFSTDHTPLLPTQVPNAQTAIATMRKALAAPTSSQDLRSYDLVWLEHLVGDVHQPLHATSRFTQTQPQGDQGGNLVALCAKPCKDELHGFWDGALGAGEDPAAAKQAAEQLPEVDAQLVQLSDEAQWIHESFDIANRSVYSG